MHTEGDLTLAQREALSLLAEELGEAVQAACKCLRHGLQARDDSSAGRPRYDNADLLAKECGDVLAAMLVCQKVGLVPEGVAEARCQYKLRRLPPYLHHVDLTELLGELDRAD
jgi:hypothetical protein